VRTLWWRELHASHVSLASKGGDTGSCIFLAAGSLGLAATTGHLAETGDAAGPKAWCVEG
jgi:hypothetical protein